MKVGSDFPPPLSDNKAAQTGLHSSALSEALHFAPVLQQWEEAERISIAIF
ncbi:hypothetical protein RISK_006608 [Rhodopirellula islandica]|uniref:Uncharacterized protein n=1 Tax=Rhodopirellula islandica TaxID=595434 RepID=A0A0J1B3X4_RHOIS|nr:hypothetical protein RISK_006608 [Rhodopirellula islandica]